MSHQITHYGPSFQKVTRQKQLYVKEMKLTPSLVNGLFQSCVGNHLTTYTSYGT